MSTVGAISRRGTAADPTASLDVTTKQYDDNQFSLSEKLANKGAASGYASLDATTHVPVAQIPSHAATHALGGSDPTLVIASGGAIAAAGTFTPAAGSGLMQRCSASGSTMTLAVPTGGVDGMSMNVEITATVATTVTIASGILLTTGLTSTIAQSTAGKKIFIGLRYSGSTWYCLAATAQL